MANEFANNINAGGLSWSAMVAEGIARGASVRMFIEDGERFAEFTFPDGSITEFVDV